MKQTELINVLKKYLNKEVRKIVREEISLSKKHIREIIREELEYVVNPPDPLNETEQTDNISIENEYKSLVPEREIDNTTFSKNPILNNILKETAKTTTSINNRSGVEDEWKSIKPVMTSDSVSSKINPISKKINPSPPSPKPQGVKNVQEFLPDDRKHRDIPDFLQNIFTRDWSNNPEIKKAADKIK